MVINYCESIFEAVPNILFCMSLEYGVEYEYRKTPTVAFIMQQQQTNEV